LRGVIGKMIGGRLHKKVSVLPGERILKRSGSVLARATGETSHTGILYLTNLRLLWLPQVLLGALIEPVVIPLNAIRSCSVGHPAYRGVPLEIDVGEREYTVYPRTWWRVGQGLAEEWREAIDEARAAAG
jgi:hypothetical protein